MKKIINGKKYDTATATEVAEWDNDQYYSTLDLVIETLYRKRTGEYFLHGDGGPMTKYSKSTGDNECCGSEQIIPLTLDEAKQWAEVHVDGEKYEEIFGEVEE